MFSESFYEEPWQYSWLPVVHWAASFFIFQGCVFISLFFFLLFCLRQCPYVYVNVFFCVTCFWVDLINIEVITVATWM